MSEREPTAAEIEACMGEAHGLTERHRAGLLGINALAKEFARALATRDAELTTLRAALVAAGEREATAIRRANDAEREVPRHLRIALSHAERAFEKGDIGALATINEDIRQLADAAVSWGRRERAAARVAALREASNLVIAVAEDPGSTRTHDAREALRFAASRITVQAMRALTPPTPTVEG